MSSSEDPSDRSAAAGRRLPRRALIVGPMALAACGFSPALGPEGAATGLQGSVLAATPTDKNAFDLVQRLEERLGRPATPLYTLSYAIAVDPIGVGITPENTITRYNLTGSVEFSLTRVADGERVAAGRVHNFTSWSASGTTVAGLAAEEDAALRLMRSLADQIVTRLMAASPGAA